MILHIKILVHGYTWDIMVPCFILGDNSNQALDECRGITSRWSPGPEKTGWDQMELIKQHTLGPAIHRCTLSHKYSQISSFIIIYEYLYIIIYIISYIYSVANPQKKSPKKKLVDEPRLRDCLRWTCRDPLPGSIWKLQVDQSKKVWPRSSLFVF